MCSWFNILQWKKIWKDSDDFWHRKLTLKVRILLILPTFTQVILRLKNFLLRWLLVLGQKKGLVHSMARANQNKSVWLVTNTTTASKYIPRRTRISINWNPPFQTSLHKIFKNCSLWRGESTFVYGEFCLQISV